jgi:hypothetical protein
MNSMNAFNNNNDFQQQIQQQQVQVNGPPFPFSEIDQSTDSNDNETEEEEKKEALPIWKITIPRQIKKVIIARIEESQLQDHFELNQTHFDNKNVTESSSHPNRIGQLSVTSSSATRTIDITDQSIVADAWYAVCIQVNVVEKGQPSTCDRCTLLKARTDSGRQQFLDFDWVTTSYQNISAELRYSAVDLPFPSAVLKTKVWSKVTYPRCTDKPDEIVFEHKDVIYPEHFLYLDIKNLVGKLSYSVQVDVEFPWKTKDKLLPQPFIAHEYLHSEQVSTLLGKCEDYKYDGE